MPPAATLPAGSATAAITAATPEPSLFEGEDAYVKGLMKQMGDDAVVTAVKPAPATAAPAAVPASTPAAALVDPAASLIPGSKEFNWDQLKKKAADAEAARDAALAKLTEAEKRLTGVPSDAAAQLAAIQKERDEISARLEQSDLSNHPKFQAYFNGAFARVKENILSVLPGEAGTRLAELVETNALASNKKEVEEIWSVLGPYEQSQLGALLISGRNLHHEKQTELSRAGERRKQVQAAEELERKTSAEKLTKEFEGKILEFAKADPLLQHRDGDADWNTSVDARLTKARGVLTGDLTPEGAVEAALWAASGPIYRDTVVKQSEVIEKLQAQVQQLTGTHPGTASGGGAPVSGGGPKKPLTQDEFVQSLLDKMKASA